MKPFKIRHRERLAVILLIAGSVFLSIDSLKIKSPTADEKIHLAGGYASLITGDFRIDPEHPPLIKQIAALPLLVSRPHLPLDHPAWAAGDTTGFGRIFFYYSGNSMESMLVPARIAMVALFACTVALVYRWSRWMWGAHGAWMSAVLVALSPNMIAHARLVTTDSGAATAALALLWSLHKYHKRSGWRSGAIVGIALGAALLSKYSLIALLPWTAGIVLYEHQRCENGSALRRCMSGSGMLVLILLVAGILITLAYRGSFPWQDYYNGFAGLKSRMASGHKAYLLGECSDQGWLHY
ncbi:glycosyltransferase family 39 protein [bacterium]|nr:glycosyltransferase family 39 protein [candidate division CSSED10-310 bacterium]